MALSEFAFQSLPIIQNLARNTRQSPPPSTGSQFEYVDLSLRILARSSVTKDEFEARYTLQEKSIRKEFERQRTWTDEQFEEQRGYMDDRFDHVDKKFEEQRTYMDDRFDQVDKRMDERFEEQQTYMDDRFDEVDKRMEERFKLVDKRFELVYKQFDQVNRRFELVDKQFEQVNRRFELVDERFDRLEARFYQLEGRVHNSLVHSPWDQIYPVGSFDPLAPPGSGFQMPEYFPNRVVKFWRLKAPRNVKRLSELLKFYNTQDFRRWGAYDMDSSSDDSDSDDSSTGYQTLEAAVRSQPEIALQALAVHLGMNYDHVASSMRAAESERQSTKRLRSKRTLREIGERPTKQTRSTPPPPVPKMTIEELMKDKSTTKSPSLKSDVLGWARSFTAMSPPGPAQVIRDTGPYAAKANASLPEQSSRRSPAESRKSVEAEEKSEGKVATSPSQVTTEEIPESERLALMERRNRERREGQGRSSPEDE